MKQTNHAPNFYLITVVLLAITLACNAPFLKAAENTEENFALTATALGLPAEPAQMATAVSGALQPAEITQTAMAQQLAEAATKIAEMSAGTMPPPQAGETPAAPASTQTPIAHKDTPGDASKAVATIFDADSSKGADKKAINAGDSLEIGLLERPFTANDMLYLPHLDIQKAEIVSDEKFIYITIYLRDYLPDTATGYYGVEIDNDFDGRGDFLIWASAPKSTNWSIENVNVFQDTNEDVGNKTPMKSDAPSSGDGYNTLVFSPATTQDPDQCWSRILPNTTAVQFAFKSSLIGNVKSFIWGVWADEGAKDVTLFDYNDIFTLTAAGSPLEKNKEYPLKKLAAVDNTCRKGFGRALTGTEPGLCTDAQNAAKTVVVPTDVYSITPQIPSLP
ncbi:MAG: hypothetical protein HPY45_11540 [Anaerolineae bacterium]|nr:hypothetical protein [Anaerolineae bacterium]